MSGNQDIESVAEYLGQQQGQNYQQIRGQNVEQNSRTSRIRAGRYEGTRTTRSREKRVVIINIIQTVAIIFAIIIAGYSLLIQASADEENQVQESGELLIYTSERDSDETCIDGGIDINVGKDLNLDANLSNDEITSQSTICHGKMGLSGPQGQAGDTGQDALSTLIETEQYEYGNSTCLTGGHLINIGYDSDSSGNLSDDEITNSESICNGLLGSNGNPGQNGVNGSSGHSALVTREVPSPAVCEIGFIIHFGIDNGFGNSTADNQILEDGEITESLKVCNSLNEGARITDTIPNVTSSFSNVCSSMGYITSMNTIIYSNYDLFNGCELWISDGTLGGDSLLLDINPTGDSMPGKEIGFTSVNTVNGELVFFDADNGQHGRELWVTDGTTEGTYMVKNSHAGDAISSTTSVTVWNQGLVFTTVNGNQLMYSNGEINNTQSVFEVELFNATQSSNLANQTSTWNSFGAVSLHSDEFGLWFNADDQSIGFEPRLLTNSGNLFAFDINPSGDSFSTDFESTQQGLAVIASQANGGRQIHLLSNQGVISTLTNLVMEGTTLPVTDVGLGMGLNHLNSKLIFDVVTSGNEPKVWSYDLLTGQTRLLSNSITYPGNEGVVEKSSSVLWFDCINPGNGVELCKTDGTISGTSVATDMLVGNLSSSPRAAITSGEYVFFIAKGEINGDQQGYCLWSLHEESHLASLAINPWTGQGNDSNAGLYGDLLSGGGSLYFIAENGINGHEMYAWNHEMITDGWIIWP
ncbi:MAG: DUF7151 family protein [Candidatus Poseidoniaceae archaeon]